MTAPTATVPDSLPRARFTSPSWEADRIGPLLAAFAPLFALTVQGWANALLMGGALLSLAALAWPRGRALWAPGQGRWTAVMVVAFIAPLAATALSALLRHDRAPAQFDAPARFLLAVPLMLAAARGGLDPQRAWRVLLPVAVLGTWFMLGAQRWGPERPTTPNADPLVTGWVCLAFGLMCLLALPPRWPRGERLLRAVQVTGVAVGLYVSVRTGSRSGWLALPLVLLAWLWLHLGWRGARAWVGLPLLACLPALLAYLAVPSLAMRVDLAVTELLAYPWDGVAPANESVSDRITFLRMGWDLLLAHPWSGVGDMSRAAPAAAAAFPYASLPTVTTAFEAGLHNQVVSNAVRTGVGGLLATLLLLVAPLVLFLRKLGSPDPATRANAAMGAAFSCCVLVASMTTEVVDLKYAASLYAAVVAVLAGAVLARRDAGPGVNGRAAAAPTATRGR